MELDLKFTVGRQDCCSLGVSREPRTMRMEKVTLAEEEEKKKKKMAWKGMEWKHGIADIANKCIERTPTFLILVECSLLLR